MAQIEAAVSAFRRQLDGQVSVPASVVQDCLLDLWGSLPEGESRSEVERWLTETLERTLYSASDVAARLASCRPCRRLTTPVRRRSTRVHFRALAHYGACYG